MPSLKDTKRRIGSVKNTQKITRAMKLVSSAKYARSQRILNDSRSYRDSLTKALRLALAAAPEAGQAYLSPNPKATKELVIVLGSDRGLCGGLNANLLKKLNQQLKAKPSEQNIDFALWGRKMVYSSFGRLAGRIESREKEFEKPDYQHVRGAIEPFFKAWQNGEYNKITLIYSEFKNALTQVATLKQLLPLSFADEMAADANLLFEPKPAAMVDALVSSYLYAAVYGAVCEAALSEHAARMTAMDNATSNADQVIRSLTLDYNRARQAFITKELIEITSGAEAL